jgi:spore germination protein
MPQRAEKRTLRKTIYLGLAIAVSGVITWVAFQPRLTDEEEIIPRPYFSEDVSYFARGNFFNLDDVAFEEPAAEELSAPVQVWTVAGTNTVSLNWTRQPLASSYEVRYSEAGGPAQTARVEAPFFTVRNARADSSYDFTVRAVDGEGNKSTYSPTTAVTPTSLRQSRTVEKIPFEVAAWLPPGFEDPDVQSSFERSVGTLTRLNAFWYNFSPEGVLEPKGGARDPEVVARAHQNGMLVIPSITNNFDGDRVTSFLTNPEKQTAFIASVVAELTTYDYDGIDLDFENVHATDREAFTAFLIRLSGEVRKAGKVIELTAQPKKSDGDNWDGPGAIDLDALRDHFDRFKPMTYDHATQDGTPGAIAPLPWITEVLNYWKTKVPPEKILAGLPFYGYDWSLATDDDTGIVWDGVQKIKEKFDTTDGVDLVAGEPYLNYSDENGPRIVYYQDAQSVKKKVETIQAAGVGGVAIWLLGSEDPGNFNAIRSKITKTTKVTEKPLNIGLKVKGPDVFVSLTRFPEIDSVKVLHGREPNQLTEIVEGKKQSLIQLPGLLPGETRYIVAVAYDKSGKEIRRSGLARVEAETEE